MMIHRIRYGNIPGNPPGNIKNKNNTNNNNADEVQQLRGGTADEKEASVLVASVVNNDNDITSLNYSFENKKSISTKIKHFINNLK